MLPEPATGRLQAVGPGKLAKLKLTYRVLGSAFHDQTRTDIADLLYSYMFAYRWGVRSEAQPSHYDSVVDSATASMRQLLAGVRVVKTDTTSKSIRVGDVNFVRELFVIEVYMAMAPGDPEQDAAVAPPWSTIPWDLLALMEEAVSRGWAAFSQPEAQRRGVEWLDLARSGQMNGRLGSLVDEFARTGYRPDTLQSLVTVEEARKRWAALAAFHKARGHFLVTNGPYQLTSWSADSVTLAVFRDLTYPLGVGSYDAYAVPRRAYITKVEWERERLTLFADIESIMKFQRSYEIVRAPLKSVTADVLKRAAPECRYMVIGLDDRVVLTGVAQLADDSTFHVDLKGKLPVGRFTMLALIAVNGNAMNADIRRIPITIASKP